MRAAAMLVRSVSLASMPNSASCARRLLVAGATGAAEFDAEHALHSTPRTKAGAVDLYDQWAPSYDRTLERWGYQVPARMAEIMREHAGASSSLGLSDAVLDAGCGTGLTGAALREAGFAACTGTDISEDSLAHVQETKPGVYDRLLPCDLDTVLPFEARVFGFVCCAGVLSYVENFDTCFREFLRVTRHSGLICFTHVHEMWEQDARSVRSVASKLEAEGAWQQLLSSGPEPYMPRNPVAAEAAKTVRYFVYRNTHTHTDSHTTYHDGHGSE